MTTKCPIDALSCVVWALVSLFSHFINTNYYIKYTMWKAVTTRTGPNDAWHIVWAISKFFLSLFLVSLILTTIYRWKMWPGKWRWQEQAQTTCHALFGPFISQFHHEQHQEARGEMTGQGGYHLHTITPITEKGLRCKCTSSLWYVFFFCISPPPGKGSYPCSWHTDVNWHLDCSREAFIQT